MTYSITLQIKNNIITFKEYLLDGIIDKKFLSHTRVDYVVRLGLCDTCYGRINHIVSNDITPGGYTNLFCPILFHDLVKPKWKLEHVMGFEENKALSEGHYHKRIRIGDDFEEDKED